MEYKSKLGLLDTEIAIKKVKDFFEKELSLELSLIRVSAPIFVRPESGLNDNLNGVERPVSFDVKAGDIAEIVHSLARSEEHTSELQSRQYLVCRLLLEK